MDAVTFNARESDAGRLTEAMRAWLLTRARDRDLVAAVRSFQAAEDLDVDGKAGKNTQAAVKAAMLAERHPTPQPFPAAPVLIPAAGPIIERFLLYVPDWPAWEPADPDGDGVDKNWRGRDCPGFAAIEAGDRARAVTAGGGFDAARGGGLHRAEDWMAPSGTIVRAPADCEIVSWRHDGNLIEGVAHTPKGGHLAMLRDARTWRHYTAHMLERPCRMRLNDRGNGIDVVGPLKTGDTLTAGEWFGLVGRTGNAVNTAHNGTKIGCPHCHHALSAPNATAARQYAKPRGIDYAGVKVDVTAVFRALFAARDYLER